LAARRRAGAPLVWADADPAPPRPPAGSLPDAGEPALGGPAPGVDAVLPGPLLAVAAAPAPASGGRDRGYGLPRPAGRDRGAARVRPGGARPLGARRGRDGAAGARGD